MMSSCERQHHKVWLPWKQTVFLVMRRNAGADNIYPRQKEFRKKNYYVLPQQFGDL